MATGEFQIVFHGEITGDQPLETVKRQLANLFGTSAERVEKLFSGKPVVVKKNIDETTARRLEQAFRRAGAACEVRSTADAAAARPETTPTAPAGGDAVPASGAGTAASAETARATAPASGSIAAAGDPNRTILDLAIPPSFEGLEIDTSDAPLAPARAHPAPEIDTGGLSLADADAGPLSERRPPPPADIDTSGLSLERLEDGT